MCDPYLVVNLPTQFQARLGGSRGGDHPIRQAGGIRQYAAELRLAAYGGPTVPTLRWPPPNNGSASGRSAKRSAFPRLASINAASHSLRISIQRTRPGCMHQWRLLRHAESPNCHGTSKAAPECSARPRPPPLIRQAIGNWFSHVARRCQCDPTAIRSRQARPGRAPAPDAPVNSHRAFRPRPERQSHPDPS